MRLLVSLPTAPPLGLLRGNSMSKRSAQSVPSTCCKLNYVYPGPVRVPAVGQYYCKLISRNWVSFFCWGQQGATVDCLGVARKGGGGGGFVRRT